MFMTPLPVDIRDFYDIRSPDVYLNDSDLDIQDEDFEYEMSLEE